MNWADSKQEQKNSIPVALCIISGYFGYFMQYLNVTGQWALSNFAFGIIVFLLSFASRLHRHKYSVSGKRTHLFFAGIIILIYLYSLLFRATDYILLYFIFYVLLPAYVIGGGFKIEIVLKVLCIVSIPVVVFYDKIFALSYLGLNQASMSLTYFVLDLVMAFVLLVLYYKKKPKWYMIIACCANIVLLFGLLFHGVRGAILTLAVLAIICYINKIPSGEYLENRGDNRSIRVGIAGLGIIIFLYSFSAIFEGLYSLASTVFPTVPGFITKMAIYIRSGNLLNGRETMFIDSLNLALKYPIFGVGVGNFGKYFSSLSGYNSSYPHNYILQLWIECGALPALLGAGILLVSLKKLLFPKEDRKEIIVATIFFTMLIFPRFLVSLNIWSFTEIWIGMFCLLNLLTTKTNKNNEDKYGE